MIWLLMANTLSLDELNLFFLDEAISTMMAHKKPKAVAAAFVAFRPQAQSFVSWQIASQFWQQTSEDSRWLSRSKVCHTDRYVPNTNISHKVSLTKSGGITVSSTTAPHGHDIIVLGASAVAFPIKPLRS